jgi:demethylmenaquinone methyltransferase / 2-methoxy-6-polyprenyl-1,4-benzoquinol methylase
MGSRIYETHIRIKFKFLAWSYNLFDFAFLIDSRRNPRTTLAAMMPNEPLEILDLCVGTANSAIAVAQQNDKNHIVGIDISPDMIGVARKKIERLGLDNIGLMRGNAKAIGFENQRFDVVMISFGLHEMDFELMTEILREMARVLKYSGKLIILDYAHESIKWLNVVFKAYLGIFETRHTGKFLAYKWEVILGELGLRVTNTKRCLFSQILTCKRNRG